MKKLLYKLVVAIVIVAGIVVLLNIKVTTEQGIDYKWCTIKIPLYLKILDFFDRHYNYKELVKRIVKDAETDQERVMKIFEWTHQNIRKPVEGAPIMDDHVWYIIVRGYGASDQSSDVFTTLCNYAGVDAFYALVYAHEQAGRYPLSFVRIEGKWTVFDPYYGVYFKNKRGDIADIEELKSSSAWSIESLNEKPADRDYAVYLENLPSIKEVGLSRPNIQSPLNRLLFELEKLKRRFR